MLTGEELLRAAGSRVTRPRLAVLDVLNRGGHLEIDDMTRRVRDRFDGVATRPGQDRLRRPDQDRKTMALSRDRLLGVGPR